MPVPSVRRPGQRRDARPPAIAVVYVFQVVVLEALKNRPAPGQLIGHVERVTHRIEGHVSFSAMRGLLERAAHRVAQGIAVADIEAPYRRAVAPPFQRSLLAQYSAIWTAFGFTKRSVS